jgi:hypothetical protein
MAPIPEVARVPLGARKSAPEGYVPLMDWLSAHGLPRHMRGNNHAFPTVRVGKFQFIRADFVPPVRRCQSCHADMTDPIKCRGRRFGEGYFCSHGCYENFKRLGYEDNACP